MIDISAKVYVTKVYEFECPHCGYMIENPDAGGLTTWTQNEIVEALDGNQQGTITCNFCDEIVRVEL